MSSPLFLSSYVLYKSALTAFLDTPESERVELSERDVMRAYARATADLPKTDENGFIEFAQRVLQVPKLARSAAAERAHGQWKLDHAIVMAGPQLVDDGTIIRDDEFLSRTGMTKEQMAELLDTREIFTMPDEVHGLKGRSYIPAFFADRRFDKRVLYAVSGSLGACTGVQKFRYFTTPTEHLGNRTPLELIELQQLAPLPDAVKLFHSNLRKR
jgi:hypothetical protein